MKDSNDCRQNEGDVKGVVRSRFPGFDKLCSAGIMDGAPAPFRRFVVAIALAPIPDARKHIHLTKGNMSSHTTEERNKYGSISSGEDLTKALAQKSEPSGEPPVSAFQQLRDICESLVVALFLAFLFKTFEAEAFVIPTGSMAPTLKGRHKDVVCDECHFQFQTSASEEIDSATNRRNGRHVVAGTCPQCGYTQYFGDETPSAGNDKIAPSFTGDRILVSKLAFDQREIQRFDVSVFRSPAEPKINFIKRVVGFPNERLRVQYGDLFVQKIDPTSEGEREKVDIGNFSEETPNWTPDVDLAKTNVNSNASKYDSNDSFGGAPFEIQRKDYRYLRQIMQVVYDADYPAEKLIELGWPERWTDDLERMELGVRGWSVNQMKKGRAFVVAGEPTSIPNPKPGLRIEPDSEADVSPVADDDDSVSWFRYRHIVPSSSDWFYLSDGKLPPDVLSLGVVANNPRLIDDFSGYNAGISRYAQFNGVKGVYEWADSPQDEFAQLTSRSQEKGPSGRVYCAKNPDGFGCNWVGDLGVACQLTLQKAASDSDKVVFDLVKGGVVFRCVIQPATGTITLEIPSVPEYASVQTEFHFKPGKKYDFTFYNVDEQMRVVVNGKELEFSDGGGRYDDLTTASDETGVAPLPRNRDPNARDLAPVAIGARGVAVKIERLQVLRDVYYIAAGRDLESWDSVHYSDFGTARCDRLTHERVYLGNEEDVSRFMSSPEMWVGYGNTKSALLQQSDGQYVVFGDNSGFSLDSRLWATNSVPHYVDRKYLIGKAFYVYWPHGLPLPIIGSPFWPNFSKMRHVD